MERYSNAVILLVGAKTMDNEAREEPQTINPSEESMSESKICTAADHLQTDIEGGGSVDEEETNKVSNHSTVNNNSTAEEAVVDNLGGLEQADLPIANCNSSTVDIGEPSLIQQPENDDSPTIGNENMRSKENSLTAIGHSQVENSEQPTIAEVLIAPSNMLNAEALQRDGHNTAAKPHTICNTDTAVDNDVNRQAEVDDICDDDMNEDDFVAIELVSPTNNVDAAEQRKSDSISSKNATIIDSTTLPPIPPTNNMNHNPLPPPVARRKILRHPILTPLTKLPWDRWITAAGNCDALFNCKYSMKQVEDEVREEHTRTIGGHYLEDGGIQDDLVGREEGYVNLSLGHEEQYQQGSDAVDDSFAEMGLGCHSMLDDEDDSDEDEQQQPTGIGAIENQVVQDNEPKQECDESELCSSHNSDILSNEQKANASWRNSNPSLDMMMYRTIIHE